MRIIKSSVVVLIFILLVSCKSSEVRNFSILRDGLIGNVDSTIIYTYHEWNNVERRGEKLLSKTITRYTNFGDIASVETWKSKDSSLLKQEDESFEYDDLGRKIKRTLKEYDIATGTCTQSYVEILESRDEDSETWSINYEDKGESSTNKEIRKFDGLHTSIYVVDEEGKESLATRIEYYPSGQLKKREAKSSHIAISIEYKYHPHWNFLQQKQTRSSFKFSEISISDKSEYAYFDSDMVKNWKCRAVVKSDEKLSVKDIYYETQDVFYKTKD